MNNPNANPPAAANVPQLPSLPTELLRQILSQNEVWQGQRGYNRHYNALSPSLTRDYMMSRATLRTPLPWKATAADRRDALRNAQNRRASIQRRYIGASALDLALISEEPQPPIDLVRPRRRDMLVFDDLKSMSKWFSAENGHPRVLEEHPNINADVLNPDEDGRIPWIRSVRFVQVTFQDYAHYDIKDQPINGRSEYAHEAFRELANATGRMALERLHIIVPEPAQGFITIDDAGIWEISHIRGLVSFDVLASPGTVNDGLVKQLKAICQGQRVRWQPTGMAYQPIWRPPPNIYGRPPNTRYDWRQLLQPTARKTLHHVQHDWLDREYRRTCGRQRIWLRDTRRAKRRKLRRLRTAWAKLDAYVVHGQNALTARGTAEFAVVMQRLQDLETQALNNYTIEENTLSVLRGTPAPPAPLERRRLNQQKTATISRRRTAQRALTEANRTLRHYTRNGFNVWQKVIKLRKAKDDAQLEYQYARKQRRAARRGMDGEVYRNIFRAAYGLSGPHPRLDGDHRSSNRQADPAGLRDEAGDLLTRHLRDVSPDESNIDPDPDYQ